ncbi:hypothetical protein H6P81_014901 [Aristolochia fimbriata]|uniref:NADP-dependent oxidoreductase domain-containing protein n=1 Tax=Aristolochia fimbriata TaxID=158543 RepID=A0AAV7E6V9_ARIFI|nr:hypothetical protein H6P81_014901 [Aristolochia fimbriata]
MASVVGRMKLGSQGLEVSAQGLGCMGMSAFYGPPKPESDMVQVIHHAVNNGITFLDTSDVYGPFTNELLVGKSLKGIREKVELATKFGISFADGKVEICGDPAYVRASCEASLKRLDVDCIDLYYQHRIDTRIPIEITMGEVKKLVEEGKIKYVGLSEASASTIRRAHAVHPITAVQLEWSLSTRDVEKEIVPTCRELGIGIVAYSPLGRGFLSSGPKLLDQLSETDSRKRMPRFQPENLEHNAHIYEQINEMATKKGCTPSQLALAWVHHQGSDVCPIPGTTKIENLNQNIGALSVKLTPEEMAELESYAVAVKGCPGSSEECRTSKTEICVLGCPCLFLRNCGSASSGIDCTLCISESSHRRTVPGVLAGKRFLIFGVATTTRRAGLMSKSTSSSLKEYLKRYESNAEEPKKKKKKQKKMKTVSLGVRVIDEEPVWQKPVKLDDEDGSESADEVKPQIDEDVEVKRMKRLEEIRSKRPYLAVSDDGSGWVSISDTSRHQSSCNEVFDLASSEKSHSHSHVLESNISNEILDLSPPRCSKRRADTPSPVHESELSKSVRPDLDLSPEERQMNHPTPDMSPPRRRKRRGDTPSPVHESEPSKSVRPDLDLSPEERQMNHSTPDLSPPRRRQKRADTPDFHDHNLTSPRQHSQTNPADLSPPRRAAPGAEDLSPPRRSRKDSSFAKDGKRSGLLSAKEIKEQIDKQKKEEMLRFSKMDPSLSGRGAEPVYRDKQGKPISKEERLKLLQVDEKPKEKKLEWGQGLAQKREAEARKHELELEKEKPFARTRDDPELDKMLKERIRWGDPMAHLIKRKDSELIMEDLGDDEKMKDSGFIIPQSVPSHSWMKRGIDPPPNRYGIRPGRHWDGVDRSTGYEKELFKRQNESRATEREAYLWSVSDM